MTEAIALGALVAVLFMCSVVGTDLWARAVEWNARRHERALRYRGKTAPEAPPECDAAVNISGEHFACVMSGLHTVHVSADGAAVWRGPTEPGRWPVNIPGSVDV